MLKYTSRRIVTAVILLWVVVTLVFAFLHLLPGDPVFIILGSESGAQAPSPEQVTAVRHALGLDRPVPVQYGLWLGRLARFDLGTSLYDSTSVTVDILARLPTSLQLIAVAVALAVAAGVLLGITAARRRGTWIDVVLSVVLAGGLSIPVFVIGTLAVLVFGVELRWVPIGGFVPFTRDPAAYLRQLALPATTLAFSLLGVVGRITRGSVLEVMHQDYVRTARAKGAGEVRVLVRHVLRTALIPIVTVVGVQFGILIGGTVLVEYIFNWPGISTLLFTAIQRRDYPTVQGIVLVTSALFILINLIVDLSYAVLDPRIRYEGGA
ncbi:MAG TPA: ABC transporter permease [bacterium]|nr:ABC transporter permease [bacterium]